MLSRHATSEDFTVWAARGAKMTADMLNHVIADCRAAQEAAQTYDPILEGFYSDQAATYADVRRRRLSKGGR